MIAFASDRDSSFDVYTMNSDGSAPTRITAVSPPADQNPDWQPAGYPRPKGATPTLLSLVPAYTECTEPNHVHGPPPLGGGSDPSCAPPAQTSALLTGGTPDANGQMVKSTGSVRFDVTAGNLATPADEADVGVTISITDVRKQSDLSDYGGTVVFRATTRVTDRLNGFPGPPFTQTATPADFPILIPAVCAANADMTVGSTCSVTTTLDSQLPGAVIEGKRMIWQSGQGEILDPGPNGTGFEDCPPTCGDGDETVFMRQGVFVP
jgi:hypothetical protein